MKWPKSDEKSEIREALEKIGGPPPAFLRFSAFFFLQKRFYQICKMKWPKSEEKIEIGVGGGA